MNEREIGELLSDIDRPREPRPEFARALREEFLGTAVRADHPDTDADEIDGVAVVALAHDPEPRRRTARRKLLAGSVAASLLVAVGWAAIQRNSGSLQVQGGRPTSPIATACRRFNRTAFADVSRTQLLGPLNASALANPTDARIRIEALRGALATFATDLDRAGIKDPGIQQSLALAVGHAGQALRDLNTGAVLGVADEVKTIENQLVSVQQAMTRRGIVVCL